MLGPRGLEFAHGRRSGRHVVLQRGRIRHEDLNVPAEVVLVGVPPQFSGIVDKWEGPGEREGPVRSQLRRSGHGLGAVLLRGLKERQRRRPTGGEAALVAFGQKGSVGLAGA